MKVEAKNRECDTRDLAENRESQSLVLVNDSYLVYGNHYLAFWVI